jgi:ABC-type amino acid transport substrate-binding protein
MEINLMNMSSVELDMLEQELSKQLDIKLRNMKYDEELDKIYEKIEEVAKELKRRKENG